MIKLREAEGDVLDEGIDARESADRGVPTLEKGRETVRGKMDAVLARTTAPGPKPDTYDAKTSTETPTEFLMRRRGEEKQIDARTPEELIAILEADAYLRTVFYEAVRALPAASVSKPERKGGMLARIWSWLKDQKDDIRDDIDNPTAFVKPNDWLARKTEVARRILASPEVGGKEYVYGEFVISAAERMTRERFALAA